MALAAPSIDDLFGGLPAEQRVERFEAYKSALSAIHSRTLNKAARGEISFERGRGIVAPVDGHRMRAAPAGVYEAAADRRRAPPPQLRRSGNAVDRTRRRAPGQALPALRLWENLHDILMLDEKCEIKIRGRTGKFMI